MEARAGRADAGALLLRGHVLGSLHRFREAEAIARRLIVLREFMLDHALLGDALVEQGRLPEAIEAYQKMADLGPACRLHPRSRLALAQGRSRRCDRDGRRGRATGDPRDPEPLAWALTRLAGTF